MSFLQVGVRSEGMRFDSDATPIPEVSRRFLAIFALSVGLGTQVVLAADDDGPDTTWTVWAGPWIAWFRGTRRSWCWSSRRGDPRDRHGDLPTSPPALGRRRRHRRPRPRRGSLAVGALDGCPHCAENCEPGPIIPEGLYKVVDLDLEDAWQAGVDANHAVLEVRERGRRLEFTFDHPNDGPTSVRFAREGPALPEDCP